MEAVRRAMAILLSLAMIWLQSVVATPVVAAASAAPAAACACCRAQKTCGCVAAATPDARPITAATLAGSGATDFHADLARVSPALIPRAATAAPVSVPASFELIPAVPLFQRNCALLI